MKRGFLNTPRSKRVIEEAYAPRSPPGSGRSPQVKPSPPACCTQNGGEKATATEDATDVEMTAVGDVSNAGNRVIAVRTTQSAEGDSEAKPPSLNDENDIKAAPPSKDPTGKGEENVVDAGTIDTSPDDTPISFIPHRLSPRRQGWGRDPDEDIFHTVPRSHGGPDAKRAVFRLWPRDPNGKALMPSREPRGTLSPDGYPWGATLYDLYYVSRMPNNQCAMSIMTGSAIWEAMRELGELDVAKPEIEWAKSEGKPRVEGVANTEELMKCIERKLQLRIFHNFSMLDDVRGTALPIRTDEKVVVERASEDGKGEQSGKDDEEHNKEDVVEQAPRDDSGDRGNNNDEDHEKEDEEASEHDDEAKDETETEYDAMDADPASIPPPPTIPVTSPFHPSHYPKPWPFIPFENPLSILLQERIPLYLLPQTLYVHDPFSLLSACERDFRNTSWRSRPDVVWTYNLEFSEPEEVEKARRKAEELEEFKARTLIILRYKRTKEQIENYEPVIEVPLPPYPRRMTKVEESHLYISPLAKVGQGHHSIVYKGEWELPRDLFARPKICRQCFQESADKEIQRLKDTGRWKKLLRAAGWGPTGFTGRQPTQAELKEVSDPTNLERDGEIIEREVTCVVPPNAPPSQIFEMVDRDNVWDALMKERRANAAQLNFTDGEDEDESTKGYVATIRIDPPFTYESQKGCTHLRTFPIPRTARFTVVAKLSIEGDRHLTREASNYQQFPERFFHHYNGYTIINQLHTIVPVNAVVPQFYGYYTPKKDKDQRWGPYLSPILLLEHCGTPIVPDKLSVEDQEECASLLLRFQRAEWIHESVAERNFLVQPGKPTEFPIERQHNPELSFRLIDFGRSRKFDTTGEKLAEEMEVLKMFQKLNGKMNVTLVK